MTIKMKMNFFSNAPQIYPKIKSQPTLQTSSTPVIVKSSRKTKSVSSQVKHNNTNIPKKFVNHFKSMSMIAHVNTGKSGCSSCGK